MKTSFISFVFLLSLCFIISVSAQDSNYGIGESTVFVQPEPAQGNSAGIDYSANSENYILDPTKEYRVSFDSETNKIKVEELEFKEQEIVPHHIGTEYIKIEEINYNNKNTEVNFSDFYYSMIFESRVYNWAWYINYDWGNFQERLNTLGNQGFRIENFDTYGRNVFNYAGTWTADGAGWAWVLNYTDLNSFINVLNSWPNSSPRYRPVDFTISPNGSQLYYGAVAKADNLAFNWIFNENLASNFITWINNQYNAGLRLVEIQLYRNSSGTFMCAGISKTAAFAQQVAFNLNFTEFQNLNTQYNNQGYRLVDFDQYYVNGTLLFGGLWNNDGIGGAWSINNHDVINFQNTIASYIASGFKPMMVDIYDGDWAVPVEDEIIITDYSLHQNYPNPFNPGTKIKFQIASASGGGFVSLKVYDVLGNEIATLVNEEKPAGSYEVEFNPSSINHHPSSGVYFCRLQTENYSKTIKMLYLK